MAYSWHGVTWTAFESLVIVARLFQVMNLAQQNPIQQSVLRKCRRTVPFGKKDGSHPDWVYWTLEYGMAFRAFSAPKQRVHVRGGITPAFGRHIHRRMPICHL
jgi:hypothetical protein